MAISKKKKSEDPEPDKSKVVPLLPCKATTASEEIIQKLMNSCCKYSNCPEHGWHFKFDDGSVLEMMPIGIYIDADDSGEKENR